jgi:predicted nucleic-acid-binding Zn-ribbon protein
MNNITPYEHSLQAMARLLSVVNETHWAGWIRDDIRRWQDDRDTEHHLSAYGGMGSFNDVLLCRANHHNITDAQEPWVNVLFNWLKEVCGYLAKYPDDAATAQTLKRELGRYYSDRSVFDTDNAVPTPMKEFPVELSGWRCLACGYSEASNRAIDQFIADDIVPDMVFLGCERFTLDDLVDKTLALDIPNLAELRRKLIASAQSAGIIIKDRTGGMKTCPKCGGTDTAVYRWMLSASQAPRFEASDNNLPLKCRKK